LVPGVKLRSYCDQTLDLAGATEGAAVVIAHEWNSPALIASLGRQRLAGAPYTLLFHDTHHRAVSAPTEMQELALDGYDAVLAFGCAPAFTGCATRPAPARCSPHAASSMPAGCQIIVCLPRFRERASPCIFRAGPTSKRCPAFRPSACSRLWRAESRSRARPG